MRGLDPAKGLSIGRIVAWLLAIALAIVAGGATFFLLLQPFSSYEACPESDTDASDPCFPSFGDEPLINVVTFSVVFLVGIGVLLLARRVLTTSDERSP